MKKSILFAAALAASMSMMAQQPAVEFHYLPTAGDVNAAGTAFTTSDQVAVAADEVLITGTAFTVKNAYATTYKAVGMTVDSVYNKVQIGDVLVDYNTTRIQGQDNPKDASGAGPALNVPVQGACYKVVVNQAGILMVAVKSTPNKNQFAFSDLTGAGAALVGTPNEYMYLTMCNNTTGTAIGNPDGCLQIYVKGDEFGELKSAPETPASLYGQGAFKTNGVGVLMVKVDPAMSPYIIGTTGSKMMAAGFAFVAANDANVANLAVVAKGAGADVTLFDAAVGAGTATNLKTQDCSEALKEVKITAYMPDEWMADTAAFRAKDLTKKFGCYVWGDGITASIHEMAKTDVANKFTYTAKYKESQTPSVNAIFINSHIESTVKDSTTTYSTSIDWNGDANQTVDLNGITADVCYIVSASANAKATAVVDEDCDGTLPAGLEDVNAAVAQDKFIMNGHLYIKKNGMVFDAAGAQVK